jgi:hypothetical protein
MAQRIHSIAGVLAILGLVVLMGSFVVAALFSSGAQLIQLIEPQAEASASLFAEEQTNEPSGTKLGTPQLMVIRDEAAFLSGAGTLGERFADKTYLDRKGIYPLQVKTVLFFRNVTALIAGLGSLFMIAVWWWTRRKVRLTQTA